MVRKFELKDKEGVDFYFYFTQKYQLTHHKNHDPKAIYDKGGERGGRGRGGRGRGRGGRDGAGDRENYENKEEGKVDQISTKAEEGSLKSQPNNEKKLGLLFQFLHKYLAQKFKDGAFADQSFVFLKV